MSMDHVNYFGHGFLHSLYGVVKFWSLEPVSKVALNAAANGQQLTVLQRRRLERQKMMEGDGSAANNRQPSAFTRSPRRLFCQCVLWNGIIFFVSIAAFQFILLPFVGWIVERIIGQSQSPFLTFVFAVLDLAFNALWLLPLFLIGKVVNAIWFQDLADVVYYQRRCDRVVNIGLGQTFANIFFSLCVQTIILVQAEVVTMIPGIGWLLGLLHHSLLCSFYCFDYRWTSEGRKMADRLSDLERLWPYYFGFGLCLAIVCVALPGIFLRGCIFSLLFPVFIVSAMESQVPHLAPHRSSSSATPSDGAQHNNTVTTAVTFSPMPILTPAVKLTDIAFRKFISKAKRTTSAAVNNANATRSQNSISD